MPAPPAISLVEEAAKLVASYEDLRGTEPHELRAHLTLGRMCTAFYEALVRTDDWYLRTNRVFWPVRKGPLTVVLLVGRVDGVVRATMREGDATDMDRYYGPRDLRRQIERGDYGILDSWAPWVNAYFLNAIRNALFGVLHTDVEGAAWTECDHVPSVKAAREAIEAAGQKIPAFRPSNLEMIRDLHRVIPKASVRTRMIWRRAAALDARVPPQNIALDTLRGRSPPPGIQRKGNALTITEQIVVYLMEGLGMGEYATAAALEMEDWRQVRNALESAQRKKLRWKRSLPRRLPPP